MLRKKANSDIAMNIVKNGHFLYIPSIMRKKLSALNSFAQKKWFKEDFS
jgi:hypothetical protein